MVISFRGVELLFFVVNFFLGIDIYICTSRVFD